MARSWAVEGSLAYAPVTAWLRSEPLWPCSTASTTSGSRSSRDFCPSSSPIIPACPALRSMLEGWQRQRLFEALVRAVGRARAQLLLVLDDANWADSDTLEWLHFMLRTAAVTGFVVLGARSEEVEGNRALAALVSDARKSGRATRHRARTVVGGRNRHVGRGDHGSAARCGGTVTVCTTRAKVIRCSW